MSLARVTIGLLVVGALLVGAPEANAATGQIRIVQDLNPGVPQPFGFTGSGPGITSSFFLEDDDAYSFRYTTFTGLAPGSGYSFTQTTPAGWNPAQSSCSDGSPATAVNLSDGESVTCTFTNTPVDPRYITVVLDRQPDDMQFGGLHYVFSGGPDFPIDFGLSDPPFDASGGRCCPKVMNFLASAGIIYSVAHQNSGGENETFTCDDGSSPASIAVGPNGHVTCTDTFKASPVIAVRLLSQTSSGQEFDFTLDGPETRSFSLHANGGYSARLSPGTYAVAQSAVPPGWSQESATCDDGQPISSITVDIGDAPVTCTFVNELTEPASLTVRLDVIPDSTAGFNFRMNGGPSYVPSIALDDDGVAGNPYSNVHTVTVAPGSGYNLFLCSGVPSGLSQVSATCSDGSSPSGITFSPNENVTCTFKYARAPSITAVVDAQPNDGQDFSFTAGGGLSPTAFSLDDDGDEANTLARTRTFSNPAPGSGYSLAQTLPAFWTQQSATCSNGSSPSSISVGATENVICTFTNVPNYPGYARPKAATPIWAPLVPAYEPCASPNRQHAAQLSFGSCNPPQRSSSQLTIGTPDANGQSARSVSYLKMIRTTGDLHLVAHVDDVRRQSDLSDYTGELEARFSFELTDKASNPGPVNATTQQFGLSVAVPCAATADLATGASCDLTTNLNTLLPGALTDGGRAMFESGPVEVYDGGPDSDADTAAGNTVFMRQGVFVP